MPFCSPLTLRGYEIEHPSIHLPMTLCLYNKTFFLLYYCNEKLERLLSFEMNCVQVRHC